MSGSDCGHIFVWDKATGAVQAMLKVRGAGWQQMRTQCEQQEPARSPLGCAAAAGALRMRRPAHLQCTAGVCRSAPTRRRASERAFPPPPPLQGDADTVNCLEPHPHHLLTLATSGIEDTIKLWTPSAEEPQARPPWQGPWQAGPAAPQRAAPRWCRPPAEPQGARLHRRPRRSLARRRSG